MVDTESEWATLKSQLGDHGSAISHATRILDEVHQEAWACIQDVYRDEFEQQARELQHAVSQYQTHLLAEHRLTVNADQVVKIMFSSLTIGLNQKPVFQCGFVPGGSSADPNRRCHFKPSLNGK